METDVLGDGEDDVDVKIVRPPFSGSADRSRPNKSNAYSGS